MRRRVFLFTLTWAMCLGIACSGSLQDKMVGKWDAYFSGPSWNIKPDGTIDVIDAANQGPIGKGKYKVLDKETIEITWDEDPGQAIRIKAKFNDQGGLVLTLPSGRQQVFVKAKNNGQSKP